MAVRPEILDNQERTLALSTREGPPPQRSKREDDTPAELNVLRERIAVAKITAPQSKDTQPHCGDCFRRGWAAALRVVEGLE